MMSGHPVEEILRCALAHAGIVECWELTSEPGWLSDGSEAIGSVRFFVNEHRADLESELERGRAAISADRGISGAEQLARVRES